MNLAIFQYHRNPAQIPYMPMLKNVKNTNCWELLMQKRAFQVFNLKKQIKHWFTGFSFPTYVNRKMFCWAQWHEVADTEVVNSFVGWLNIVWWADNLSAISLGDNNVWASAADLSSYVKTTTSAYPIMRLVFQCDQYSVSLTSPEHVDMAAEEADRLRINPW